MNKKFFIAWIVLFIAWFVGSFVVHGVLLHDDYARLTNLFRPEAEAQHYFALMILAGVMICDVAFSNQMSKTYPIPWKFEFSLYLTFAAVAFNWLAIRFIRKDEKMVRDSDRIR